MKPRKMKLPLIMVAGVALFFPRIATAQVVDEKKAAKVEAAYLYNFSKFVAWPDNAFDNDAAPLVIGVLGADSLAGIVGETVKGKTVRGRKFTVKCVKFEKGNKGEKLRTCHILYISRSERAHRDAILAVLDGTHVLTVSDDEAFVAKSGMIGLVMEEGRIVFHINRAAAERAGLKLSAKLLKLAAVVKPEKGSEVTG